MVLEHALLPVRPGREADFEAAFAVARALIAATPGFRRLSLSRCLERPGTYLLLVEWDRVEDHTRGFRGSPAYQRWRGAAARLLRPVPHGGALPRGPHREPARRRRPSLRARGHPIGSSRTSGGASSDSGSR